VLNIFKPVFYKRRIVFFVVGLICYHTSSAQTKKEIPVKQSTSYILFETAKYNLDLNSKHKMDSIYNVWKDSTNYKIYLYGNTDSVGDKNYNLILSNSRVESVGSYLHQLGIDTSKIKYASYGENSYLMTNLMINSLVEGYHLNITDSEISETKSTRFYPFKLFYTIDDTIQINKYQTVMIDKNYFVNFSSSLGVLYSVNFEHQISIYIGYSGYYNINKNKLDDYFSSRITYMHNFTWYQWVHH